MADNEQMIAVIPKNATEEIRVTLGEFNGRPIFGARVWFQASDGSMRPGKSGIAFKIELLEDFALAVSDAADRVRK